MTDTLVPDQPDTQPLELSLRFADSDDTLRVSAQVQQLGIEAGPVEFAVPLDKKVMADLHWYLEVYPKWPVGPDYQRALAIESKLRGWGKQLFDAVFAEREMLRVYDVAPAQSGDRPPAHDRRWPAGPEPAVGAARRRGQLPVFPGAAGSHTAAVAQGETLADPELQAAPCVS